MFIYKKIYLFLEPTSYTNVSILLILSAVPSSSYFFLFLTKLKTLNSTCLLTPLIPLLESAFYNKAQAIISPELGLRSEVNIAVNNEVHVTP